MQIFVLETSEAIAQKAADIIQQTIKVKSNCILGLATGSSPIATYQELIKRYQKGEIDFGSVKTFNLDEYYGLQREHPQSYYTFMQDHLFQHINIPSANINVPSGTPQNIDEYCKGYEKYISDSGGIDLQLLGIGNNGHIGFNEPAEQLEADTHLVRLTDRTIEANSRFFNTKGEVPRFAITMGIRTILLAKEIVLLAQGREKAGIIKKLLNTGITTSIPASFLKIHPNVTVLVDQEAGSQLNGSLKESVKNE